MVIFLIDFDGTCVPTLPGNGYSEYDTGAERVLKKIINSGNKLVLWTARNNSRDNPYNYIGGKFRTETSLEEAERWFKERNIPLFGINEWQGEEELVGHSRKLVGNYLIDDTSVGVPLVQDIVEYINYDTGEISKVLSTFIDWNTIEKMLFSAKLIY